MRAPLTLPITTRGVGINLCSFYADIANLLCTTDDDEPKVELPNIYASYRALLALVERRFYNIQRPQEDVYRYSPILRDFYNINIPIIFKRYLEAINIVEYKHIRYFPAMPACIDGFIPRPENILLSNLRQTVEALRTSDVHDDDEDDGALQHRESFYKNNPIPGAIWDRNTYKLINADEIIPPDYNLRDDIYDDMNKLLSFSIKLRHYSKYIGKYNANQNVDRRSFSSFICNEMDDLHVPDRGTDQELNDYYWNSRPRGNIDMFYSRFRLRNDNFIKDGTLFLLGEYPNYESFVNPFYELRAEAVNSYFYPDRSYHDSYLSYHSDIVARSLQNV